MEEKKTTPNNATQNSHDEANETPKAEQSSRLFSMGNLGAMLSVKEQKSLLFYIAVGIILVEFAVTVGALITGIAGAEQLGHGKVQFNFPWTGYLVTVVVAPIIVILLVNLIGMGFYRAVHGEPAMNAEQFDQMPEKARNFFSLVRGAPTIILFGGIVILGAVLYYLDGVMSLLLKLGDSVETLVIWGTCGLVIAWCLSYCARMWLMYRTRRLEEDYAFRREVLERTGMVILDGKNMLGSQEGTQYVVERALPSGGQSGVVDMDALPAPEASKADVETVAPEAEIVTPDAEPDVDKDIVDAEIIEPEVTAVKPETVVPEPEVQPEFTIVEPEVSPTSEAEVVNSVAEELKAEPVPVESVKVVEPVEVVEVVETVEVQSEAEIVEAEAIIPEVEVVKQEAEIVADDIAGTPQTVAIVHIAVNALFDAKSVAEPVLTESEPAQEVIAEVVEPNVEEERTEVQAEIEVEPKAEPELAEVNADIPVTKPTAPQSPQAPQMPQEPRVVAPKPPVRRARLSEQQKRRS